MIRKVVYGNFVTQNLSIPSTTGTRIDTFAEQAGANGITEGMIAVGSSEVSVTGTKVNVEISSVGVAVGNAAGYGTPAASCGQE